MALFDSQEPTPYGENTIYRPANLEAYFGKQTGTSAGTRKGIESAVGAIPIWGQAVQGATAISNASASANTDVGDFFSGFTAPHTTAFNYWDLAGRKQTSPGDKAKYAFQGLGALLGGPIVAGIMSEAQGHKRRQAESVMKQLETTQNHPFDFSVDKKGLHYAPQNIFKFQDLAGTGVGNVPFNINTNGLAKSIEEIIKRTGQKKDVHQQAPAAINNFQDNGDNSPYNSPTTSSEAIFSSFGQNQDNVNVGTDSSLNFAPPIGGGQTIETTPSGGNMDWNTGGSTWNMNTGGTITVGDDGVKIRKYNKGGSVMLKGGKGGDDLAVIDTNTGKDTGVRMEKGEMVVFSKDTLSALNKALSTGDKKGVFDLVNEQVSKTGDGGGFAEGGSVNIDDELATVSKRLQELKDKAADKKTKIQDSADISKLQSKYEGLIKRYQALKAEPEKRQADYKGTLFGIPLPTFKGNLSQEQDILKELQGIKSELGNYDGKGVGMKDVWGIDLPKDIWKWPTGTFDIKDEQPVTTDNNGPQFGPGGAGTPFNPKYQEPITAETFGSTGISASPEAVAAAGPILTKFPTAEQSSTTTKTPFDWQNTLTDAAGYGADLYRLIEGAKAASTKVPVFHKPAQWNELIGRLHMNSLMGLTPQERALYQTQADRQYATDVSNIYNLSGGNSGTALANLGRANMNRYTSNLQEAALDRTAMNQNLNTYGQYLGADVNLDRMIFGDAYNQAVMTKQAGAGLMSDALQNAMERSLTNKYYGPNSQNKKLLDLELENQGYLTEVNKNLAANAKNTNLLDLYKPTTTTY